MPPQLSSTPDVERSASVLRDLENGRAWRDRSLFERYLRERHPVDRQVLIERPPSARATPGLRGDSRCVDPVAEAAGRVGVLLPDRMVSGGP